MKNKIIYLISLLVYIYILGSTCKSTIDDMEEVSEESYSSKNLHSTSEIDNWDKHKSNLLAESSFTIHVCSYHFKRGSDARKEIEKAILLYNNVPRTTINIKIADTEHKTIEEMYANGTDRNFIDYVDNRETGFPCHKAGEVYWYMNTCKYNEYFGWNGLGKTKHFSIAMRVTNESGELREHYKNPETGTDYFKYDNIAHEIGHVFGMIHLEEDPGWPEKDQRFVSTMMGNSENLTAYDIAFLQHFYPSSSESNTSEINFVASSLLRIPDGSGGYRKGTFYFDCDETGKVFQNPNELYLKDGKYLDCSTDKIPIFQAAWFNTSNVNNNNSTILTNRFRIGPEGGENSSSKVTIKVWKVSPMPALSQDYWKGKIILRKDDLNKLSFDTQYQLTFKVDNWDLVSEKQKGDNLQYKEITLRKAKSDCDCGH